MDIYNERSKPGAFVAAAIGGGTALLSALILLLITSLLLMRTEDPVSFAWVGRAILFLCAAFSGFIPAKCTDEHPFPSGLTGGAIYSAVVILSSLVSSGKTQYGFIPVILGCFVLGAFLGSIRREGRAKLPDFNNKKYGAGS